MRTRVLVAGIVAMIAAPIAWQTLAARQVTAVSLVVRNGIVITVDGNRRILNPGSIAINGSDIVAIDTPANIAARYKAADTIDATGKVVMPGLINTHTHAAMVMYRGLGNDLALMDWLQKYIFPAEAKTVSPEFVRVGTRLAAARDDPVRHHALCGHVLLRGGGRARHQGGGPPRRPRTDGHRIPGSRREDAGRRAEANGSVREGVRRTTN